MRRIINAYLVESQGRWMLVDCGLPWGPSLRALGRALKAIGVPRGGLTYLVLTHRHPDHSGATGPVQERWGGEVLLHPVEAAWRMPSPEVGRAWLTEQGVDDPALLERLSAPPRRPEEILPDSVSPLPERFTLGALTFETILAPGHSWGHVMLREESRGWLLFADQVLTSPAPNVWAYPGDPGDPLSAYLKSLAEYEDLPYSLLLPGHGAPGRGGWKEGCQAIAAYHRAFAQRIFGLAQVCPQTTWEIMQQAYPRWASEPGEVRFILAETLAALRYLASKGAVRLGADGRWEREGA
ncbi:MAG: MBL fold metallo-hydrolase [Bacillota bacterium]